MASEKPSHLKLVDPNSASLEAEAPAHFKSGGLFVALNLAAGLLHYLYQAVASRQLPLLDFSALNAWYANLAMFFAFPQLLQFGANFLPLPTHRLRSAIVLLNGLVVAIFAAWFYLAGPLNLTSGLLILAATGLYGWLCGQAQSRLLLGTMAVSGLVLGFFKLALLATPLSPPIEVYTAALLLCNGPGIWFLSVKLWRDQRPHPPVVMTWQKWVAPVILSAAAATFPQMDLVILNQTQGRDVFAQFAQASLFYKALYFAAFAYMQWLLPHQVRAPGRGINWRPLAICAAVGVALSAIAALAGPPLGLLILKWPSAPSARLIFLSCVNTSLLTWMYVQIQSECARGRLRSALLTCGLLMVEVGVQFYLRLDPNSYLLLAIAGQSAILASTYWLDARATIPSSRPEVVA